MILSSQRPQWELLLHIKAPEWKQRCIYCTFCNGWDQKHSFETGVNAVPKKKKFKCYISNLSMNSHCTYWGISVPIVGLQLFKEAHLNLSVCIDVECSWVITANGRSTLGWITSIILQSIGTFLRQYISTLCRVKVHTCCICHFAVHMHFSDNPALLQTKIWLVYIHTAAPVKNQILGFIVGTALQQLGTVMSETFQKHQIQWIPSLKLIKTERSE